MISVEGIAIATAAAVAVVGTLVLAIVEAKRMGKLHSYAVKKERK